MDLFEARFKKEGILNADTGMDYRQHILEPGSTKVSRPPVPPDCRALLLGGVGGPARGGLGAAAV